jgi:hypothetical protein
LSFPVC